MNIDASFTVDTYSKFSPKDLDVADRAYVKTASGNVYRIERSKSRPGQLKFHNERAGKWEYCRPELGNDPNIEVGKQMYFAELKDPDDIKAGYTGTQSSPVVSIDVWRNHVTAQQEIDSELQTRMNRSGSVGVAIAQGVANAARGKVYSRDYTKKPEEQQ